MARTDGPAARGLTRVPSIATLVVYSMRSMKKMITANDESMTSWTMRHAIEAPLDVSLAGAQAGAGIITEPLGLV